MTIPGTEDCQPDPAGGGARVVARGFGWHHAGRERPAFSGLDLEIAPGEKVLLLGPSGAGKSTLLHALAGVLEDDEDQRLGSVVVDGRAPADSRGAVGLMQQDPEASVVMARVGEDLAFGPENLGVDPALIPERSREALEAVGLDLDLGRSTSALSGGQKQRLGLAGILAMRPSLLLLDEPTANLDPAGVEEVRDAVLRAARRTGATLVVVEHRVGTWAPWMDRVVVLSPGGGVSHEGPPESVLSGAREELVDAGIWVPGLEPVEPAPQTSDECQFSLEPLLVARDLAVTREQPTRRWEKRRRKAARTAPVPPTEEQAQQEPWARAARMAAAGIRARVLPGRHLAVLGPNGCGKSTFALALAGLAWPGAGTVAAGPGLEGEPGTASEAPAGLGWDPMAWPSPELARRIGTVFQEPEHQFMRTTVRQELELGARMAGDVAEARTKELLEVLRLDSVAEANPFTLSGGEKRRLSVGTALAARPAVLVLDEPTFGQDALTWAALVRLLRGLLSEGTAVVSVTHDAEFVAALGGEVLELDARAGTSIWTPRGEVR